MTDIAEQLQAALADRYRLDSQLGQGGMATVWLARDLRHDRDVALKVLRPELSAVLGADRFLSEIRIAARLDHPHILTLIDSGATDGILWYVLPYVRGDTLRHRLEREKQLAVDEAVDIGRQVAGALDYAHRQGVVHRDVKPENILFHEGEVVLADFGIALALREAGGNRLTETGLSLGTPQYMSPEQATGDRALDARSDIYSLGAVMYEMLTGEPPHSGATVQAVIAKLMTERPTAIRTVRETVSPELEATVSRALAKVPADRWTSAADFSRALESAGRPVPPARPVPPVRLDRRILIGGALVLAAVVAGAFALAGRNGARPSARGLAEPIRTQFTFSGDVFAPSISPDGRRIAFVRQLCDSVGICNESLIVQDLGGAGALTLLEGWASLYFVQWSSDGRWLLALGTDPSARFGTFILPSLGGPHRYVGPVASFLGGPDTLLVLPEPDRRSGTTWWRVATTRDGVVRDSIPVQLDDFRITGAMVAPGGRSIAAPAASSGGTQSVLLLDRTGAIRDRWEPAPYVLMGADWQGDDAIVFAAFSDGGGKYLVRRRVQSSKVQFDGPPVQLARLDDGSNGPMSMSGDGRTIAMPATVTSRSVVTLALEPETRLLRTQRQAVSFTGGIGIGAQVAPSGTTVAMSVPALGGAERRSIVLQPFGGGPDRVLVPPTDSIYNFEWAPGRDVMYYTTPGGSGLQINQVDAGTGQSRVVGAISAPVNGLVDFEPLQQGGFVWLVDGDPTVHFQLPGDEPQRLEIPGVAINFTSSAPGGFGLAVAGFTVPSGDSGKIFIADLKARTSREIWAGVVEDIAVAWLPDGSLYATLTERQGTRAGWTIYTDSRPPVRHGLVPFARATYRIAADGIRGSALVTDLTSDAWLLHDWDPEARP